MPEGSYKMFLFDLAGEEGKIRNPPHKHRGFPKLNYQRILLLFLRDFLHGLLSRLLSHRGFLLS